MTDFQFFDPYIRCECGRPSFLPRQNPSETTPSLDSQPNVEWSLIFLCISCGRVTVHLDYRDDEATQPGPLPDLWRIECVCDHENCGKRSTICATYDQDSLERDVRQLVIRRSAPVPCNDHSFRLTDATVRRLERFPVR